MPPWVPAVLPYIDKIGINFSIYFDYFKTIKLGFPGGAVVESLPANAEDTGSSPGLGRSHMPQSN